MSDYRSKNMILFYFITFTVVVILIFAAIISSYYLEFYGRLRTIKKYLKLDQQIGSIYTPPRVHPQDPVLGSNDALVTIIEYSDFTCPSCRDIQSVIDEAHQTYGNRVRIIFKGIPITRNPERTNALHAAYCAAEQNSFWAYKKELFARQLELSSSLYTSIASQLKLDMRAFEACMSAGSYQSIITRNTEEAIGSGVTSTPTLYVNDIKLEGVFGFTQLKKQIDAALSR